MKQIMMCLLLMCMLPLHSKAQVQTRTSETTRPTSNFIKSPVAQPANPQRPPNYGRTSDILNNTSYQNNRPQPVRQNNGNFQGNADYHDPTLDNRNPPANSTQSTGLYTR